MVKSLQHNTYRSSRKPRAHSPAPAQPDSALGVIHNRLPTDWLTDAVKGFLPGSDPNATTLLERPGISVRVAAPRYLFAMKAAAARIERDADDLLRLDRLCGFDSVDEAVRCVEESYPPHLLPPKTAFILQELIGPEVT